MDSNSIHSGSAMLMLLTVVLIGVAAFFIYKFKRSVYPDSRESGCTLKKKKKITKKIIDFAGANTEVFFVCPATCRKIPWIHVQAEDSQEKDPEVISTVGQNDNMSKVKLSEFPSPKELVVKDLEPRSRVHAGKKHPSHRNILVLTTTKSTFTKVQIFEYFRFPKF